MFRSSHFLDFINCIMYGDKCLLMLKSYVYYPATCCFLSIRLKYSLSYPVVLDSRCFLSARNQVLDPYNDVNDVL